MDNTTFDARAFAAEIGKAAVKGAATQVIGQIIGIALLTTAGFIIQAVEKKRDAKKIPSAETYLNSKK